MQAVVAQVPITTPMEHPILSPQEQPTPSMWAQEAQADLSLPMRHLPRLPQTDKTRMFRMADLTCFVFAVEAMEQDTMTALLQEDI